ncbi:MAG TPA: hypothetical protein VGE24_13595, partial [Emticicia sp.]
CSNDSITEQSDTHHDDHECSNCSPFMTCGSCIGFTFHAFESILFTRIVSIIKDSAIVFFVVPDALSDFFSKIWQPPRLA